MNYIIFSRGWQFHSGPPKAIMYVPLRLWALSTLSPFSFPGFWGLQPISNAVLFIHCVQLHFVGTVF